MNSSATGGYILPHPQVPTLDPAKPNLTLVQFIQTLLVGLSALGGTNVRPNWQKEPLKQPDIDVNWLAFGINNITPDANAYIETNPDGSTTVQRQELIEVGLSVYGPSALDNITLIRDGLQVPQNMASLKQAAMAFAYDAPARHMPDLINERWCDRFVTEIFLRRYVVRDYPILTFLSATGTVYTQTAEDRNYQLSWKAGP